jgi:hypothetical protein
LLIAKVNYQLCFQYYPAPKADILFIWCQSNEIDLSKACFDEAKAAVEKNKQLFLIEVHGNKLHLR